jgi:hypothetical protein
VNEKVWYLLRPSRRCRMLGHRWYYTEGLWHCIRYGCEAWLDPTMPDSELWLVEEFHNDLPPLPKPEAWGPPDVAS